MASETAEFYKNKNIFITGGTGFLGIALIEKLLRATPDVSIFGLFDILATASAQCIFALSPNLFAYEIFFGFQIGKIYLLMREKRDKTPEQRLEELTKNEVRIRATG